MKVVGLDRERLLGFELVIRKVDEREPLQEHAEDEGGFLQSKLSTDASALPGAEGLVGVRRDLAPPLRAETVRIEPLWLLAPHLLVPVQHSDEDRRRRVFLKPVLAPDHRIFIRVPGERRRCRPQTQRLLQDLGDTRYLVDLSVGGPRLWTSSSEQLT